VVELARIEVLVRREAHGRRPLAVDPRSPYERVADREPVTMVGAIIRVDVLVSNEGGADVAGLDVIVARENAQARLVGPRLRQAVRPRARRGEAGRPRRERARIGFRVLDPLEDGGGGSFDRERRKSLRTIVDLSGSTGAGSVLRSRAREEVSSPPEIALSDAPPMDHARLEVGVRAKLAVLILLGRAPPASAENHRPSAEPPRRRSRFDVPVEPKRERSRR